MKKFTLLAGLALVAGAAYAAEPQVINNLKMSTVVNELDLSDPANDMYYYRISNMRIQRLSYIKATCGNVYDGDGYEEDNILTDAHDNAVQQFPMPTFLPGKYGDPEDIDIIDPEDLTPQLFEGDYKYAGLANWDGNWWMGFSSIDEVVNPATRFWYFTAGKNDGTVYIHNAVQQGSVKNTSSSSVFASGAKQACMGFDTKDNMYFVQPVAEALEEAGFDMSLTEEELKVAFALSVRKTWSETSNYSLDVNNYVSYTMVSPDLTSEGEQEFNADGDSVYRYYGFVGADRTWSPIRTNGVNTNHEKNNGTLWFVEEAQKADADKAIADYTHVIVESYKELARRSYAEAVEAVAGELEAYVNLPALVKDQNALQTLIGECNNVQVNVDNVKTLADVDKYGEMGASKAQTVRGQLGALVGHGAIVTLKNMTAIRDLQTFDEAWIDNEETAENFAYGEAYIAAGQKGTFTNAQGANAEAVEETGYVGIGPMIKETPGYDEALCQWELIPVWGTATFKLYNAKTNSYIMNYNDSTMKAITFNNWEEEGLGTDIVAGSHDYSWATTEDETKAAAFTLQPCPDKDTQAALSANDSTIMADYSASYDVLNNVRLVSYDNVGGVTTNIHRTTSGSAYKFVNYDPTANRWYAESNIFHVDVVVEGSINDIAAPIAPKAQGIYDLQGRKVAKAQKGGLYIINGVKTIVR